MKIVWKSGSQFKVDAETAYREVERVRAKHDGEATAETVLQAAAAKRNPLHHEFEWDDPTAAHEYRLTQARSLLRSIHVIRSELKTDRPQRVYEVVRAPSAELKTRNVYRSIDEIMADPDARAERLSRALRELVGWQRRYRDLQELAIVFRAAAEAQETIQV